MRATCFLKSSCACTSCPLPFPSVSASHSTCCGCRVRLSTLEAFHASNSLITHTHRQSPAHSSPIISSFSSFSEEGRRQSVFWVWLAQALLKGGLGSHSGLTVEVLVCRSVLSCSENLLRVFPSLWLNLQLHSGQTKEKR